MAVVTIMVINLITILWVCDQRNTRNS